MAKLSKNHPLALTQRCVDLPGLLGILQRGDREELVRHVARCPACRRVAVDGLHGLMSSGDPNRSDSGTISRAGLATRGDEEEAPPVVVRGSGNRIETVVGAPAEILGRGQAVLVEWAPAPLGAQLRVETEGDIFILRLSAQGNAVGSVVVLRSDSGEPIAPPRRLEGPIAWSGLRSGRYRLTIAGTAGSSTRQLVLEGGTSARG